LVDDLSSSTQAGRAGEKLMALPPGKHISAGLAPQSQGRGSAGVPPAVLRASCPRERL